MVSFSVVYLIGALFCIFQHSAFAESDSERWKNEIEESLKRNIHQCTWKRESGGPRHFKSNTSSDYFTVKEYLPKEREVSQFRNLPITLSRGNPGVKVETDRKGYTYKNWASKKELRWEIPRTHVGQNKSFCIDMSHLLASGKTVNYYESFKTIDNGFYLLTASKAFIHPMGSVVLQCGYFQGQENCESRWPDYSEDWHKRCRKNLEKEGISWEEMFINRNPTFYKRIELACNDPTDRGTPHVTKEFRIARHKRVFVIDGLWDFNYHHFVADSLARLARHYKFLKSNPDIMIHVRYHEEYDMVHQNQKEYYVQSQRMRNNILELLGININRVVTGAILADEVFLPRCMRCAYAISNPLEIRLIAKHLLTAATEYVHTHLPLQESQKLLRAFASHSFNNRESSNEMTTENEGQENSKKKMVILQRYTTHGSVNRAWNNVTMEAVVTNFAKEFPNHEIIRISSKEQFGPKYCLACDILQMSQADILVGVHGAGFTNMMFMKPESLLVEFAVDIADVSMPYCGYYGPFSAIFGHHHYLYGYYEHELTTEFAEPAAKEAAAFYNYLHSSEKGNDVVHIRNPSHFYNAQPNESI